MITGAHVMLNVKDPEGVRAWFRDVLDLKSVDAGDGWLIFKLPPAELGVHPTDGTTAAELFLLCDDVEATRKELAEKGVESSDVQEFAWGSLTTVAIPGDARIGIYQPKHAIAATL